MFTIIALNLLSLLVAKQPKATFPNIQIIVHVTKKISWPLGALFPLWSPSLSPPSSPLGLRGLKWHTVADCRPGLWVLALAGWICVAAGEPAALFLACSINSGSRGTDWSHTLISDSGAEAQLLTATYRTGGEEARTKLKNGWKLLVEKKKKEIKTTLSIWMSAERLTKFVSGSETADQSGLGVDVSEQVVTLAPDLTSTCCFS